MGCLAAAAAFTISSTQLISHFAFGIWALLDVLRCHLAENTGRILEGFKGQLGTLRDIQGSLALLCFKQAAHFMASAISPLL